jgi:hypothetical protein
MKNALRTACIDLDECALRCGPGINKTDCNSCDPLTKCHNTVGLNTRCMINGKAEMCGYSCDPCPQGFTGSGMTGCLDINECKVDSGGCDPAPCINTVGSFYCGDCPTGYQRGPNGKCVDINECEFGFLNDCYSFTKCFNTKGSYSCGSCPPGYWGDGFRTGTGCKNIDECLCLGNDGKNIVDGRSIMSRPGTALRVIGS